MIENSCCKELFEKCAGNSDEMTVIKEARNALVNFYIKFSAAIIANSKNPDEQERKKAYQELSYLLAPTVEGVENLNKLCADKNIDPVFTGNYADNMDIYKFAKQISDEIMNDMQKNLRQQ